MNRHKILREIRRLFLTTTVVGFCLSCNPLVKNGSVSNNFNPGFDTPPVISTVTPLNVLGSNYVPAAESTSSTSFTSLTTPDAVSVTLTAPTQVVIDYTSSIINNSTLASVIANIDGTNYSASQYTSVGQNNSYDPQVLEFITTLSAGTHTITVEHSVTSGTTTWSNRLLTVNSASTLLASSYIATAQTLSSSGSYTDLPTPDSVTFTVTQTTQVVINFIAQGAKTCTGTLYGEVFVDGTLVPGSGTLMATTNEEPALNYALATLSPGTHTIDVQVRTDDCTATWSQRNLTVWPASSVFLATNYVATTEYTSSTTYTDLTTLDAVTITLPTTTTLNVQYMAEVQTGSAIFNNVINVDGIDDLTSVNGVFIPNTWSAVSLDEYKITLAAGTHTIKVRHALSASIGTAGWSNRLLLVRQSP